MDLLGSSSDRRARWRNRQACVPRRGQISPRRTLSRPRAVGLTVDQLSARMMNLFPTAEDRQAVGRSVLERSNGMASRRLGRGRRLEKRRTSRQVFALRFF